MRKEKSMFLNALERAIDEIKLTSFHSQYRSQLASASFRRQDYKTSDFVQRKAYRESNRNPEIRYTLHIDMDLVHPAKRSRFKRSGYYGKLINMETILENRDIFVHLPLVLIDSKIYTSLSFRIFSGYCEMSFTKESEGVGYLDGQSLVDLFKNDLPVTIMFTPNINYGVFENDVEVLNMYNDELNKLNLGDSVDGFLSGTLDGHTFATEEGLIFPSSNDLSKTEKLSTMVDSLREKMYINVIGWKNLHKTNIVKGSDTFFRLEEKMPVPKENILIFERVQSEQGGRSLVFSHTVKLRQYYPHTYELLDHDDSKEYEVYVFYSEELETTTPFVNDLKTYEKYMGTDPLDYNQGGIVHELAKEYLPEDYIYTIPDYKESEQFQDHTLYKIRKFEEWVGKNPNLSSVFLKHQVMDGDRYTSGFYLDMNYVDLEEKVRYDNKEEIHTSFEHRDFDEPHYVFILRRNEESNAVLRFYIDGEFYVSNKFWYVGRYEYHYIPTRLVKNDSIIEVEKFESDSYNVDVLYRRLRDTKIVNFDGRTARRNDIFILNLDNDSEFVPREEYTISILKGDTWVELKDDSFDFIDGDFRLNIHSGDLVDKQLRVMFTRSSFIITKEIRNTSATETFKFKARYNNDVRQIRIFRNSRLLSQNLYDISLPNKYGGITEVNPGIMKYQGDEYVVDVTPNHYHVVYSRDTIPLHGVVDLRGKLPKPLDLKWFDFYLNGRRLSIKELEFVSPMILAIRGVSSLRNLVILERNKERSMSSIDEQDITVIENLYDVDDEFRDRLLGYIRDNENTEDDIVTEIVTALDMERHRIIRNLLPFIDLINPDIRQIHSGWGQYLERSLDERNSIFINPDDPSRKPMAIFINPDEEIDFDDEDDLTIIQ